MAENSFRNGPAIVEAITIEAAVHGPFSGVTLICGHCGKMTRAHASLNYSDPDQCGLSYEEQEESWRSSVAQSETCRHCGVINVAMGVEDYLRGQRESKAKWAEFFNEQ